MKCQKCGKLLGKSPRYFGVNVLVPTDAGTTPFMQEQPYCIACFKTC